MLTRTTPVFSGGDERLDHLGLAKIAAKRIQFVQPEV